MLDKDKEYSGYSIPYRGINQPPCKRFKRVKILFEDDISWYVESLTDTDSKGNGKRYSVKKHCFALLERSTPVFEKIWAEEKYQITELDEEDLKSCIRDGYEMALNWVATMRGKGEYLGSIQQRVDTEIRNIIRVKKKEQ
jgi:hypothetical protein